MMKTKWIAAVCMTLLLTGCSTSKGSEQEKSYVKDDYLVMKLDAFSNNGYFYISLESDGGIHFVDQGNFTKYDLKYHQMEDDPNNHIGVLNLAGFYEGKVLFAKAVDEDTSLAFMMCDPDGTNESELCKYALGDKGNAVQTDKAILANDHLYTVIKYVSFETGSFREVFVDIDMKTKQMKELMKPVKTDGNCFDISFIYNDALYFTSLINLESEEYSDTYLLYKRDLKTEETELLRDDLANMISFDQKPVSNLVYFGYDAKDEEGTVEIREYNIDTNKIKEIPFSYDIEDGKKLYYGGVFDDIVKINVFSDSGAPDVIFFTPATGEKEYINIHGGFKPFYQNDQYVFGYSEGNGEDYLCSYIAIEDFKNRDFSKQIVVKK